MRSAQIYREIAHELMDIPLNVRRGWMDAEVISWWLGVRRRPDLHRMGANELELKTLKSLCATFIGRDALY